jgi:hypothetical protein
MIENVIITNLKAMKFTDWNNETEADNFCKLADELTDEVNTMLSSGKIKTFVINGVNIIGSNFEICIFTPEEFMPYEGDEIVIQLRSNGKEIALFFLDSNKQYAFRHSLNIVAVYEMKEENLCLN